MEDRLELEEEEEEEQVEVEEEWSRSVSFFSLPVREEFYAD